MLLILIDICGRMSNYIHTLKDPVFLIILKLKKKSTNKFLILMLQPMQEREVEHLLEDPIQNTMGV